MGSVFSKIYTALDTVFIFFGWVYSAGQTAATWIANEWHILTEFLEAVPLDIAVPVAVIAAIGLVYLVLGR